MTSPMTPQLEKIARAICLEEMRGCAPDWPAHRRTEANIQQAVDSDWRAWVSLASACLSALLPPSEEMVEAMATALQRATDECSVCGMDCMDCVCTHENWQEVGNFKKGRLAFTAAIQSILSEGEGA